MVARISCVALVVGFLAGCYDIPQPECGFACGPAGECPSDYSCNSAVNRCELDGSPRSCATTPDAGMDTIRDAPDDFTPPQVIFRAPAEDTIGVGVGDDIFVDFSESVTGVSNASFTVTQGGLPVAGSVTYSDIFGSRATFTQSIQLAANSAYTVNLTSAIRDTATLPNPLMPVTWIFTTGPDQLIPAVQGRSPINASTGIPVTAQVSARFDEQVLNVTTTSFTLTPQGGSPVATTVGYTAGTRTATLMVGTTTKKTSPRSPPP